MSRFFRAATLLAALLLLLNACADKNDAPAAARGAAPDTRLVDGEAEHEGDEEGEGAEVAGPIRMDAAAMHAAGIRVETLASTALSEELRAPGEVVDNAYGTTLITPRVEALVLLRHARLGDEVQAGTALATLTSVEVSDAQAELQIAEQEWRRVSALGREAVAGRRINEAKIAVERARARARAYGLNGRSQGEVDGQFTLNAPHAGRITEDAFVVGERIEPGSTLFRLVDETIVWVDARVSASASARVTPGTAATVVFNGERLTGTVQQAAHRTSDATRNALVRVEVPNINDRLHAGDFVEVFFESDATGDSDAPVSLSVPSDALVQLQGETVVFRTRPDGALEPTPVRPGEVIGDRTFIRDGLAPGDVVVVAGAFVLKSQMLKSQLGEEE